MKNLHMTTNLKGNGIVRTGYPVYVVPLAVKDFLTDFSTLCDNLHTIPFLLKRFTTPRRSEWQARCIWLGVGLGRLAKILLVICKISVVFTHQVWTSRCICRRYHVYYYNCGANFTGLKIVKFFMQYVNYILFHENRS